MKNGLVVKSNDLIQARYDLSLLEQKIILYAVSMLDREREKFNILSLSVSEFSENLDGSLIRYSEIKEVVERLMDKKLYISTDDGELITHWVSSLEYKSGSGVIDLEFSEKLVPYLLQLKNRFTSYQLKNILYLKNKYSVRIYELLKQYQNMTTDYREFELDELKKILMIEEGQYERIYDLEKWVLKPVCEEINANTDINTSYEKVKKGRKVVGIRFYAQYAGKEYKKYLEENYDIHDLKNRMGLDKENFNAQQIMELYGTAIDKTQDRVDVFLYVKLNYVHMILNGTARNKFAYLKKALEEDYAKAYAQLKQNYIVRE